LSFMVVAFYAGGQFFTGNAHFDIAAEKFGINKKEPNLKAFFITHLVSSFLVGLISKPMVDASLGNFGRADNPYTFNDIVGLSVIIATAALIQHIILKTDMI
jgi:hypothetical protein